MAPQKPILPPLRADLVWYEAPQEPDNIVLYNLYDPVANRYYQMRWVEKLLLYHYSSGATLTDWYNKIRQHTTLRPTEKELGELVGRLVQLGLVQQMPKEPVRPMQVHWLKRLLSTYLFFRVPLFNPKPIIDALHPWLDPILSWRGLWVYSAIVVLGLTRALQELDTIFANLQNLWSIQGLITYSVGLTLAKALHECAHAYAASRVGAPARRIGMALILFWPTLYTDITDTWRLKKRTQRLWVSSAGILAEVLLGGLCWLIWSFLPDGAWRQAIFVLAATSWFQAAVINLNPAMRFDGYYILSDIWGMSNLQPRAFAYIRYLWQHYGFGVQIPSPEQLNRWHSCALFGYGIGVLLWRFFAYTAIAAVVYYKFTKSLGVFLFAAQIVLLFFTPLYHEIKGFMKNWSLLQGRRGLVTTTLLLGGLWWISWPQPSTITLPAFTEYAHTSTLWAPFSGQLQRGTWAPGDQVTSDATMLTFTSDELVYGLNEKRSAARLLKKELLGMLASNAPFEKIESKQIERAKLKAMIKTLKTNLARATLRAPHGAIVTEWTEKKEGDWFQEKEKIGTLANPEKVLLVGYLPEHSLEHFEGIQGSFSSPSFSKMNITLLQVEPYPTDTITHPSLTVPYGGNIEITREGKPRTPWFKVTFVLPKPLPAGMTGKITWTTPPYSRVVRWIKRGWNVLITESGF